MNILSPILEMPVIKRRLSKINAIERRTFKLHLLFTTVDGMINGLWALGEFILLKSLLGTNVQVGVLFQFQAIFLLLSVVVNEFFKRIPNKKRLLIAVSLATRLPLVLLLFFPASMHDEQWLWVYQYVFLAIGLAFFSAQTFVLPVINLFLKQNYEGTHFGTLFGYATTIRTISVLISTFLFGFWLDHDHDIYRYVMPCSAIISILSIFWLIRIPYKATETDLPKQKLLQAVREAGINMIKIMRHNKPFRDFQYGFMLYGLAWMMTISGLTIYFEKVLGLNYSSVAFYKNFHLTLTIAVTPFYGKLLGRVDPRRFAAVTFGFFLLHVIFAWATHFFPQHTTIWGIDVYYTLFISYIFFGFFGATMTLLWFIGSAYFCKPHEAANYQAVHLTMTGIRGSIAPLLGVMMYEVLAFNGVMATALLSISAAIFVVLFSMHKYRDVKRFIE